MNTLTYQPEFRPALPLVYGPIEFREKRDLFIKIDDILIRSGFEEEFIQSCFEKLPKKEKPTTAKAQNSFAALHRKALRSGITRGLIRAGYRGLTIQLAESSLLQWFTLVGQIDQAKVYGKSTAHLYEELIDEQTLRKLNNRLLFLLGDKTISVETEQTAAEEIGLSEPVCYDQAWFDTTCLKANIHYPTDWVLLRDAARTLMQTVTLIRKLGLKNRMPQAPMDFLSDMNTLCMKMSASARKRDGKKAQKKVFRSMKKLAKKVSRHAEHHLNILISRREETDLSKAEAQQHISRIESMLEQLPIAIKQAHERIIGNRPVPNKDKILSLYERDIEVIVRGKAGARVEFGNKLWLGENSDGLIIDYKLYKEQSADSTLVRPAIERLTSSNIDIKVAWGDRGLSSKENSKFLEREGVEDGLCPRSVAKLAERLKKDEGFRAGLKRRAGTEARVSIFTLVFMGKPLRAKGFKNREHAVGWGILVHNLWVAGRMIQAAEKARAQARAA